MTKQPDKTRPPAVVRIYRTYLSVAGPDEAFDWLLHHIDAQDRKLDELKASLSKLRAEIKRERKKNKPGPKK